ncbi:O-methyltransferase [Indioceanicola profundi]|uniref:hypothetical protein n=1 Tax=Indioceanicola profundi TaxID=2220096 RepID=UPI000E6ABD10|nr:hypothetical protein [Indioceanicola profundi]
MKLWIERHRKKRKSFKFARSYLEKMGWFESLGGMPRNKEGDVPWITYPAFRQVKRLIRPDMKVFEYGCGGSSLWWARNVAEVVSVEHDAVWAGKIREWSPPNLNIMVRQMDEPTAPDALTGVEPFFASTPDLPLAENRDHNIAHGLLCREFTAYAAELTRYGSGYFDVVVVDGMARCLAAWLAARYVKPDGFIIFDNSDRWQYNAGYRHLREYGFHRIDYYGPGPVNLWEWCTSLFTRSLEPFSSNVDSPRGDNDLGW